MVTRNPLFSFPRLLSQSSYFWSSGMAAFMSSLACSCNSSLEMSLASLRSALCRMASLKSAPLRSASLRWAPLMATIGRFLAIRPDSCKNCTTDVARRGDHRRAGYLRGRRGPFRTAADGDKEGSKENYDKRRSAPLLTLAVVGPSSLEPTRYDAYMSMMLDVRASDISALIYRN